MKKFLQLFILILFSGKAFAQPCNQVVFASYFPGTVCPGTTLSLGASTVTGATYSWTGPGGFASISQNPVISSVTSAGSGSYIVTATAGSCVYKDTVNVVVNIKPTAPVFNSPNPKCKDGNFSYTLSSTGGTGITYGAWRPNGTPLTSPLTNLQVSNNGIYKAVATNSAGCKSDTGTYNLTVIDLPQPSLTAIISSLCIGDTLKLTVGNNTPIVTGYTWSTPTGSFNAPPVPLTIPNITSGGNYSVRTTYQGCTSPFSTINIALGPQIFPSAKLSADGEILVNYSTLTITANVTNGGMNPSFQWYKNAVPLIGETMSSYTGIALVDIMPSDWFYAEVKRDSACGGIANSDTISLGYLLSVQETKRNNSILLYPNPNNGSFTLGLKAAGERTIEVVNTVGSVVYRETLTQGTTKHTISLPGNISNGIYLLRIRSGEAIYQQRFTVSR